MTNKLRFSAVAIGYEIKESATWKNVVKYAYQLCKSYPNEVVYIKDNGERYASFKWNFEANDMIPA